MEGFEIEIPVIEIPVIEIPDIEIPDIEIPEIEMEEMEMEEMEMAEIEIPGVEFETENRARRTNRKVNQRVPQQGKGNRLVKIKVNDYIRCSVCTVTFCNFMFLGTSALICSLKALNRKISRDVAGARRFGCCALTANIFAIIGTIIFIVVFFPVFLGVIHSALNKS